MKNKEISPKSYSNLFDRIVNILVEARTKVVREINKTQVLAYWEIGREIVEFEQKGQLRAEYGEELLKELSVDMTVRFEKGFSERNLRNMRAFYLNFPIRQTVSRKFTIQQTVSAISEKRQTLSDEFEPSSPGHIIVNY
jgi:Holliday junction resolvasome RuvABC ATP-dependent DNA helicase subunit